MESELWLENLSWSVLSSRVFRHSRHQVLDRLSNCTSFIHADYCVPPIDMAMENIWW